MGVMDKPVIGVTTSVKGSRLSWLFNRLAVWLAGGRALCINADRPAPPQPIHGLIIGGGDDIGAGLYGGEIGLDIRIDPARDALERRWLDIALHEDLPVLGICRGAQMINIGLGGTLHQDVRGLYDSAPRGRILLPRRAVRIKKGSRLHAMIGRSDIRVNSLHKQAVHHLGAGLEAVAHDRGGMVQAVEHESRGFLLGVQWHPELLFWDRRQGRLFKRLCDHALRARAAVEGTF